MRFFHGLQMLDCEMFSLRANHDLRGRAVMTTHPVGILNFPFQSQTLPARENNSPWSVFHSFRVLCVTRVEVINYWDRGWVNWGLPKTTELHLTHQRSTSLKFNHGLTFVCVCLIQYGWRYTMMLSTNKLMRGYNLNKYCLKVGATVTTG